MCGFVSPFGKPSPPVFGQTCNPGGNLFSLKPSSETTSPFGVQTGASVFGGTTSVGGFGTTQSSGTTSPFGVRSLFDGTTSASVFGTAQSPGGKTTPFGVQNDRSVFRGTTSADPFGTKSSSGTTSPFGLQSGGSIFGGTCSAGVFGTTQSSARTSPFGVQTGGSVFGGMSSAGVFGTTQSSARTSPFGVQSGGSVFGGTTSAGVFGTTQSSGGTSPFGVQSGGSVFGGNTSAGVFGTTQSSGGTTSPFGVQSGGSVFGGTTSAGVFGTSPFVVQTGGSVFGWNTSAGMFGTTQSSGGTTSPFGVPQIGGSFLGGTTSAGVNSSPLVTPFATVVSGAASASGCGINSTPSIFSSSSFPGLTLNLTPPLGTTPAISKPPCSPQSSTLFPSAQLPDKVSASFQQTPAAGNGINNTPSILNSSFPILDPSASTFNLTSPLGTTPTISKPLFPSAQLPEKTSASFQQTPAAVSSIWGGVTPIPDQATSAQRSSTPSTGVVGLPLVTNPFGTLPAMPHLSVGRSGFGPSTQYGISNMPVTEKPAPVRASTLLISRHLSQRRTELAAMKYRPKNDDQKVPFFWDDEETPAKPKADAFVIARENPRALLIHPTDKQWSSKTKAEKMVPDNGKSKEKKNAELEPEPEPETDGELLMPKLQHSDYYTESEIHELKEKERVEPGFCSRVKGFVVGRYGYGSMKFVEEIDVQQLDIESIVEFNNREVIVYMDESKKPPVGQGLNKAAEVTLLNIKCLDKKTGEACTDGAKVDRFREMLEKKAKEQGAEFVSYDPVRGEWKFRVQHF